MCDVARTDPLFPVSPQDLNNEGCDWLVNFKKRKAWIASVASWFDYYLELNYESIETVRDFFLQAIVRPYEHQFIKPRIWQVCPQF
jgi:hypothetical protein